jgi:hypothetical protein
MVQNLITRLVARDESQSRAYAVALERALGELSCLKGEIELEQD